MHPVNWKSCRGEIADKASSHLPPPAPASDRHALRNRLNAAKLAGHLARRQLQQGDFCTAEQTLDQMLGKFQEADRLMESMRPASRSALLVDDDRNERELLAAYLRSFGYQVSTVGDGIEALEYLQDNEAPDVVLLDMVMPRCDGARTIQQIRETPSLMNLRVFAVSGSEPEDVGVRISPEGVNGWFAKPLDPEQILKQLRSETGLTKISA